MKISLFKKGCDAVYKIYCPTLQYTFVGSSFLLIVALEGGQNDAIYFALLGIFFTLERIRIAIKEKGSNED